MFYIFYISTKGNGMAMKLVQSLKEIRFYFRIFVMIKFILNILTLRGWNELK